MNNPENNFQQQILFSEQDTIETESEIHQPPIVIDNDNWQAIESTIDIDEQVNAENEPARHPWLMTIIGIITLILGVECWQFFYEGFQNEPILTSLYASVFLIIITFAGIAGIKEVKSLRRLKQQHNNRQVIAEYTATNSLDLLTNRLNEISQNLPSDFDQATLDKWHEIRQQSLNAAELTLAYQRIVLQQIDQKALAEVAKFSAEAVVLIALSPVAVIDMAIILWRNLKMIEKIAGLYGVKLGFWSRISLVKQVVKNMAYAGASEIIADFGSQILGAELLGKLSAKLAQGAGAGALTARLGVKAIHQCRPIIATQEQINIKQVRSAMLEKIKSIALPKQK